MTKKMSFVVIVLALAACSAPDIPRSGQRGGAQSPSGATPKRVVATILGDAPVLVQALNAFGQRGTDAVEELVHVGFSSIDSQGILRPMLAEAVPTIENGRWQVFPDGRMRTTWKLREGALWHDGTPVSVQDFTFAARVAMDREVPEFADAGLAFVDSVEALDGHSVHVTWRQPYIEAEDRKSTRLNSSHIQKSRMPSSA